MPKRNHSSGYFGVELFRPGIYRARRDHFGAKRTIHESSSAEECALAWDQYQISKRGFKARSVLNFPERFQEQLSKLRAKESERHAREIEIIVNARRSEPLTTSQKLSISEMSATGTLADVIAKKLAVPVDVIVAELLSQRHGREANENRLNEFQDGVLDSTGNIESGFRRSHEEA
ncbi:MAG: hypothetical protein NDJ89_18720 [Oligoflexia bacterium]|nr:hypothetical protein [Oligoflexia bacterium]